MYKKRGKYSAEQLQEIHLKDTLMHAAVGEERKRLKRRLNHFKYKCRKENWRDHIRKNIRNQDHWKLFKAMDRNNSILQKREVNDNVLADRAV